MNAQWSNHAQYCRMTSSLHCSDGYMACPTQGLESKAEGVGSSAHAQSWAVAVHDEIRSEKRVVEFSAFASAGGGTAVAGHRFE
eukprot:CAMPEP_0202924814 /NCGR_PEP_ID=MMETSP1392-20130828/79174_1 /ASSEMBLY_ACC=CAM_ASM_000868 /TAXON_ID=225041 /ORGANISM="Chlamydomonas chlamydogama, Strain SAG 11-48b" /LENGTH=83 /DNA_ID=CAMNT_0049618569 /DNA_START=770 /DNA_END=1022 /DNA_ORIENTATION=+